MTEKRIGTREEWQAARDELAKLEAEQAERNEEIKKKRLELPWVPVEKEYEFDTEEGKKTPRGALRRPLTAPRLQHHVRARLRRTAPAPAAPVSRTASTVRSSTSTTAT